jgi:hypothetical protein
MVKSFIKKDMICHYGLPRRLITDNTQNFNGKLIAEPILSEKLSILTLFPTIVVEASNKNLKKII